VRDRELLGVPGKSAASTIHFLPGMQAGDREKKTPAGIFSCIFYRTIDTIALRGKLSEV